MRACGNEDDLCDALNQTCDAAGAEFVRFVPEESDLATTLSVLGRCRIPSGIHGGAFSNMLLLPARHHYPREPHEGELYHCIFKDLADSARPPTHRHRLRRAEHVQRARPAE